MVERFGNLFKITSELNDFIDLIICIQSGDLDKANKVITVAYDSYWEDDDACNHTISEWIAFFLADFDYDFYFKEDI